MTVSDIKEQTSSLVPENLDDAQTYADLDRDLRFHPAQCANPRRLTQEQIRFYNKNGYLKGIRIYGEQEVLAHRAYFDRALERVLDTGKDSYSIRRWQTRSRMVWDIVTNPQILDYVEDLLGPNILAWGTHFFCKLPGDGKTVSWHQDASYWPLTPAKTVTLWLAIDDSDRGNGCMQVLPGTHTLGHLDFDLSGGEENSVLPQKIRNAEQYGEPVYFELKAGEISLHADMLVHGSEPNNSTRRRCGFTVRYAATEVRASHGWNQNSVLCRGVDPEGHWANWPRPEKDVLD